MSDDDESADVDVTPTPRAEETGEHNPLKSLSEQRTVLRGVLADAYELDTTIKVGPVILRRSEWKANIWDLLVVDGDGEENHVDSINASAFHSTRMLEHYLKDPTGRDRD